MPSVVIFVFGEKPQTVLLEGTEFLIGRSDKADICLPHEAVSRSHATIVQEDRAFKIVPMNVSNSIVLNGKDLEGPTTLPDEAELQFGPFLVLFSRQERPPSSFLGDRPFRFEMKCEACGWSGLLSGFKTGRNCPRCGGKEFVDVDGFARSEAARDATGPTSYASPAELAALARKVKAANRTKVARMRPVVGLPSEVFLDQQVPVVFGKPDQSNMPVKTWLRFGPPAEIRWESGRYVAIHEGKFPGMKVNGTSTRRAPIQDGDTVEIGGQLFNVSTE